MKPQTNWPDWALGQMIIFLSRSCLRNCCCGSMAILRRAYKEDSPQVNLDGCTIDFSRAEVRKGGQVIPLTAKEYTLLETLARNEGRIVTVDAPL